MRFSEHDIVIPFEGMAGSVFRLISGYFPRVSRLRGISSISLKLSFPNSVFLSTSPFCMAALIWKHHQQQE